MRDLLRALFGAAVAAAQPAHCLAGRLPNRDWEGRTRVLALGKAAAGMARVAARHFGSEAEGLVIAPLGANVGDLAVLPGWRVITARHPVPDAASLAAGEAAMQLVSGLGADDVLIALISGGGSSLMVAPAPGLTLEDKQALNAALLRSGLPIAAMNRIRQALSRVKGGRLALAAAPARVLSFVLSDVPGDDPAIISSGPTVPPSGPGMDRDEAMDWLSRLAVRPAGALVLPPPVAAADLAALERPQIVASASLSLDAAARLGTARGLAVSNLGGALEGPARVLARDHAEAARALSPGQAIVSGGEASVALPSPPDHSGHIPARGGRNLTFLLELAIALDGAPGIHAIAADTDGLDGTSPAAGGIIGPDTLSRARSLGLDPADMLAAHRSHDLFAALGDLVVTGPTGTNVNDFRAIVRWPEPA